MSDIERKTDKYRIEDAFALTVIHDFEAMPKNEHPVPYSVKFLKKMDRLLKRESRFYFRITNTAIKRVAVAAIAVLIISGSMLSIGAVRRAVAGFFADIYEAFTRLTVAEDQYDDLKTIIEEVYTLAYVPEGYDLVYENRAIGSNVYQWYNDDGKQIELFQMAAAVGSSTIDTERNIYEEIYVEGFNGIYLNDYVNDYHLVSWVYDGYVFEISCPLSISKDTIIEMAKSIMIVR